MSPDSFYGTFCKAAAPNFNLFCFNPPGAPPGVQRTLLEPSPGWASLTEVVLMRDLAELSGDAPEQRAEQIVDLPRSRKLVRGRMLEEPGQLGCV